MRGKIKLMLVPALILAITMATFAPGAGWIPTSGPSVTEANTAPYQYSMYD